MKANGAKIIAKIAIITIEITLYIKKINQQLHTSLYERSILLRHDTDRFLDEESCT
jgi:hypothetical protein